MLPEYVVREYDGDECVCSSDPMKLEDARRIARKRATDWNLPTGRHLPRRISSGEYNGHLQSMSKTQWCVG